MVVDANIYYSILVHINLYVVRIYIVEAFSIAVMKMQLR
jgi:hypothetical protein